MLMLFGGSCVEGGTYKPPPPSDPTIPTMPQPRLPQNDAYEGSAVLRRLQPRFVWEAATVEVGMLTHYELQYTADKEFVQGVKSVQVVEPSFQPAEPLEVSTVPPVGRRYYWRVRACAGETCSEFSRPWWVNLGRSMKDFNGDGYDDIIVSWHANPDNGVFSGKAVVYFGNPGPSFDALPDGILADSLPGDWFGIAVSPAGDFNGDGYADVLVGAYQNDGAGVDSGAAYLYFGGPGLTLNTQVDVIFLGEAAGDLFGGSVACAGDMNGDGFSDVAVGAGLNDRGGTDAGCGYVFLGNSTSGGGQLVQATTRICGKVAGDYVGTTVSGLGDLNGDGFADLGVSGSYDSSREETLKCSVSFYFGAEGKSIDSEQDGSFSGVPNEKCQLTAFPAGDVNRDGFSDAIAVASIYGKSARLYLGSKQPDAASDMIFNATSAELVFRAAAAGDINGDGMGDIMFRVRTNDDYRVFIHLGKQDGAGTPLVATPAATFVGPRTGGGLGYSIASAGDVNGDGFDDLVFGDPTDNESTGRADLYFGNGGATMDTLRDGFIVSGVQGTSFGLQVAQHSKNQPKVIYAARQARRR